MNNAGTKKLIEDYMHSWAKQDRDAARSNCAESLRFVSPQDKFASTEEFFSHCWKYSEGLADVKILRSLYTEEGGFAIIEWIGESGQSFIDAEYFRVENGKIVEILVVNNFPEFAEMVK